MTIDLPNIPGATVVDLDDPETTHNLIASAIGETTLSSVIGTMMEPASVVLDRDARPFDVRIVDFETSDFPANGGVIIETGWTDLQIHQTDIVAEPVHYYSRYHGLPSDVEIAIGALMTHHIRYERIQHLPRFDVLDAAGLLQCEASTTRHFDFLVAHNAKFEMDMLARYLTPGGPRPPFICTMKCARIIYPDMKSHALQYLRYSLDLEDGTTDERCMPPHAAGPDTWLTYLLLKRMLSDGHSILKLAGMSAEPSFIPRCPVGKYKGKRWAEIETPYLVWIVNSSAMGEDVKAAANNELFLRG